MRSRRPIPRGLYGLIVSFSLSFMIYLCREICSRISIRAALTASFVGACIVGLCIAYTTGLLYRMMIAVRIRVSPTLVSDRLKAWIPYGTPPEIGTVFDRSRLLPAAILEAISAGELNYDRDTQTIKYSERSVIARPDRHSTYTKQELVLYFIEQCRCSAAPAGAPAAGTHHKFRSPAVPQDIVYSSRRSSALRVLFRFIHVD